MDNKIRWSIRLAFILFLVLCSGCAHIKPWEKEFLLKKAMQPLKSDFPDFVSLQFEHLPIGSTANTSSACPTCGG